MRIRILFLIFNIFLTSADPARSRPGHYLGHRPGRVHRHRPGLGHGQRIGHQQLQYHKNRLKNKIRKASEKNDNLGTIPKKPDEFEYEYAEDAENVQGNGKGDRIIGGQRAPASNLSFIIGFNTRYAKDDPNRFYSSGTANLIHESWVLTAQHVLGGYLPTTDIDECVERTTNNSAYFSSKGNRFFKCTKLADGHLKVEYADADKHGMVFLGVDDFSKGEEKSNGEFVEMDYWVQHADAIKDNNLISEGYDIVLIHLAKPSTRKPICLPKQSYKDTGIGPGYSNKVRPMISGYGFYYRDKCITDKYGEAKFHFCEGDCRQDKPPQSETCKSFFANPSTPNAVEGEEEEIVILNKDLPNGSERCFRESSPTPGSKGWCKVKQNLYDSWGFCDSQCNLPESGEDKQSTLRIETDVDILDEKLCNLRADPLYEGSKLRPKVICVSKLQRPKYSVWEQDGNGYKKVENSNYKHPATINQPDKNISEDFYLQGDYACYGDSGGPIFAYDEATKQYVVFGLVADVATNCGGFNSFTVGVRVKPFVPWIQQMLGEDAAGLCLVG